jgi:DNA polymerase-3 subunit beta
MKFSCQTSVLLQSLQLVSRAISGQQALPILGNVLLQAEGKRCTVSATDLEISIVTSFEAAIENEGSITIPAKAILNFAQYTTDPEVVLETAEGTQMKCTGKHGKTVLSGELATEYPTIAPVEKNISFAVNAHDLLEALHLVTFTCARTSLRPVLSGVSVRTEGGKLILVGTDSYRLSEYVMQADVRDEISCIIPVKVLEEVRAAISGHKAKKPGNDEKIDEVPKVQVTLSAQQVELQVGSTRFLSRLIEGKFPDYRQIIPKETSVRSVIATHELTASVRRMHYFAKEVNNNLTFVLGQGDLPTGQAGVQVRTPQTPLGKDEATVTAETSGGEAKIALSSSYLLDFLSHVDDANVELQVVDGMHPAVFKLPNAPQFLHLIMPLRMQD